MMVIYGALCVTSDSNLEFKQFHQHVEAETSAYGMQQVAQGSASITVRHRIPWSTFRNARLLTTLNYTLDDDVAPVHTETSAMNKKGDKGVENKTNSHQCEDNESRLVD
ncbi:hypothetical protein Sjap_013978 [Stephania japonica]|uniref:Uncharacterized protein n=1 Tax=Stephania japonica TaxID=461633 RepID=A0AAP0P1U1_9MAGN